MAQFRDDPLPPTFNRLAWSNLAAQSAEQIALAAAPIVAVLMLGVAEGGTGLLQTALTLPCLLGFIAVCGTVAYSVAAPALVPSLVPSQLLPAANARIELARTIAYASGPALGGVLVGWVGAAPAFGFAAALSIIAVVLLSGIYEPAREPAPPRHPLQEIR